MQTFLPYADYRQSLECLDWRRCWKQCIEARQIIDGLNLADMGIESKRLAHPAFRMWRGYQRALVPYYNICLEICKEVHCIDTVMYPYYEYPDAKLPLWYGYPPFHASHRMRLLDKDFAHYSQFGWSEQPACKEFCIWPVQKDLKLLPEIEAWHNGLYQ